MSSREEEIPQAFGPGASLEIFDMRVDGPWAEALGGQIQLAFDRIEMLCQEFFEPTLQSQTPGALGDVHAISSSCGCTGAARLFPSEFGQLGKGAYAVGRFRRRRRSPR